MTEVVHRHAAAIDAGFAWCQRGERLGAAGEGVGEPQGHSRSEAAAEATAFRNELLLRAFTRSLYPEGDSAPDAVHLLFCFVALHGLGPGFVFRK